ncbi:hypothetical protein KI387_016071, partial [Taxus chinensis]
VVSLLLLVLFVHPSDQRTQGPVLSKFLKERRSRLNTQPQQWIPPSISSEYSWRLNEYSQDGLQENDRITALPGQPTNVTFAHYSGYVTWQTPCFWNHLRGLDFHTPIPPLITKMALMRTLKSTFCMSHIAARDSYKFLLNWFERFPQYKNRDFYITGESYAGYYVPQLADTILKNNNSRTSFINLKGVMIGNGIMNDETDECGSNDFMWSHALMSDEDYENVRCSPPSNRTTSDSRAPVSSRGEINLYNIYAPLCASDPGLIWASGNAVPSDGLDSFDPCSLDYVLTYLNTPEVQRALHANVTGLPFPWDICSGDVDAVVPVTGTRYSVNALKLPIETAWYPWMNGDLDVGGYAVIYKGLTFATVRGAGHQVPSYQPSRALTMTKFFLAGKPLPS